jgi:hypothetical protein
LHSRALRLTYGIVALIAIGAAAFILVRSAQYVSQETASLRAFDQHAHAAGDALVDARVGQQAYVAAGQSGDFWFFKTTASLQSATDGLTKLGQSASAGARTAIDDAAATVAEFSAVDKRARDYLKSGQQLMAGDVIFTEGSAAAATAVRQIEIARQAQHQASDVEVAAIRKQDALTAGGAAGVVFLVVLLLIPVPHDKAEAADEAGLSISPRPAIPAVSPRAAVPSTDETVSQRTASPNTDETVPIKPASVPPQVRPLTAHAQGSVFKAATDVVTDFGRVRDLDELTRALGRAAEVMDASGLMVWVGSASGADLRPVVAHGYSEEMLARMPPVPRSADNAAAAAYRSGAPQIVHSRPGGSSGAVVAPILSADGCIGALSAEIRSGGETSQSVQALASIFAAQLAWMLGPNPTAAAEIAEPRAAAANS